MAYSAEVQAHITTLSELNANKYVNPSNLSGLRGIGYQTNIPKGFNAMAAVANAIDEKATQADTSASNASTSEQNASSFANSASSSEMNAANSAAAAAASAAQSQGIPNTTTAGTGTAYTVTIVDYVIGDGSRVGLNFHTANTGAATLAINGGTAYAIVEPGDVALESGRVTIGMNLLLEFDSSLNKWVIIGALPINKLHQSLNANNQPINNVGGMTGAVNGVTRRGWVFEFKVLNGVSNETDTLLDILPANATILKSYTKTDGTLDYTLTIGSNTPNNMPISATSTATTTNHTATNTGVAGDEIKRTIANATGATYFFAKHLVEWIEPAGS